MNFVLSQATRNGPILKTLTGVDGVPLGIAEDATGAIFVSAFPSNIIDVYAPGSTTPTSTLTDSRMSSIYYITMDQNGNLFDDGWGPGGPNSGLQVDEFRKGSPTSIKLLTIPGKFPGGLAYDTVLSNLYVADEGNGTSGVIERLKPPYHKVFRSFSYTGLITGIDLDSSGKHLFASNLNVGGADVGQKYDSHTGALLFTTPALRAGLYTYGIAVEKK